MNSNHFDGLGRAVMVDVAAKEITERTAVAEAQLRMEPATLTALLAGRTRKGDVLGVSRLAGIAAAKKTPDLIPLSHPLALHHVAVGFAPDSGGEVLRIRATVKARERTGVEMEAMTAVSVAALTVYDMCKGHDRSMVTERIQLVYKAGGKSGVFRREGALDDEVFDR